VVREDIGFDSGGQHCQGWLYRPPGAGWHPCVVLAHGIGGIRSAALPAFATRFAAAGIAALTFDYRRLGTSEGQPRGLIDIRRQRADLRAVLDLACRLDGVDRDRIALWGTSFGGGHVLATAAREHRIAAAIIQNPFVDGRAAAAAAMRSAGRLHAYRLAGRGICDEVRNRGGRDPLRVALAGPPGTVAMMTTPDAVAGFESILPPTRVLRPGGRLIFVDHIQSTSRIARAGQRTLEMVTVPLGGEHFLRRPLNHVRAAGFDIERVQRFKLGLVERLVARKPNAA
jgi:acetyl esterase/lipase